MNDAAIVLQATGLARRFKEGGLDVQVLSDIELTVRAGETLAVVGASGSGKSTLLHLLGGLDAPTRGRVTLMGRDLHALSPAEQGRLRNEHLGFVYQFHHLLPEFSAIDNVAMPLLIRREKRPEAHRRALEMLDAVDADSETGGMIALAEAIRRATRSDPGYVRHLFDQFAGDYDARMLGPLRYAAPQILWDLAHLVMGVRSGLTILDLGCGTGLAGAQFCGMAERLDGVDLSPGMLEKARARGLYDTLARADLETALATPAPLDLAPAYDLILAADTLVYLGDLGTVFRNAAARLAPDGYFLFTVEADTGRGFSLGPKRRWRHAEAYLRAAAAAAGLTVAGLVAAAPRSESPDDRWRCRSAGPCAPPAGSVGNNSARKGRIHPS